jgi:phospholipid/cholesterol/gamma-HCH transport system substrate-binding protein
MMMARRHGEHRIAAGWLATALAVVVAAGTFVSIGAFNRSFDPVVEVTLTSDRAGLVMDPNAKVKLRGVQVGRVADIEGGANPVSLTLDLDPDQVQYIPANVIARINATSLFGAKFVDLQYPEHPEARRIAAGAVLAATTVATEVNTVFENLVELLKQIDPSKINGILSAVAEGVRGQGQRIGEATTAANDVVSALNDRTDVLRADFRAVAGTADVYSAAAGNILKILDTASTTGATVTAQSAQLDKLLLSIIGFGESGTQLFGPAHDNLIKAVNTLEPTTDLLLKYNPELTCLLVGAQTTLDDGLRDSLGGADGKSTIMDAALMLGDDAYKFPDNLPINGAKGGPGGKPGCGSLPDVAQNWPVRQLIANTGFGTGLDWRPNPGIGFPGIANYFPVTKAIPEPPRIRYPGGPAPGPIPYPGAPPYGAPQYGPDGTPFYPGVPPAPAAQTAPTAPAPSTGPADGGPSAEQAPAPPSDAPSP